MEAELLMMSKKEQDRSEVIRLYVEGYIKQKEAAKRLGISARQIRVYAVLEAVPRWALDLGIQDLMCAPDAGHSVCVRPVPTP